MGCVRSANASFDARGLSTGFASRQTLLFGIEIILLERLGNSGAAIIAELNDTVSANSATDAAIELKFVCDCENNDAELPWMFTLAKTENSCAEDVPDVMLPGGDCSPSLVL